jgi:hypothetical protein
MAGLPRPDTNGMIELDHHGRCTSAFEMKIQEFRPAGHFPLKNAPGRVDTVAWNDMDKWERRA